MLQAYSVNFPTTAALALVLLLFLFTLRRKKGALPLGPRGKFIVGNFGQLPKVNPWLTYAEWVKTYGKIYIPLRQLLFHKLLRQSHLC